MKLRYAMTQIIMHANTDHYRYRVLLTNKIRFNLEEPRYYIVMTEEPKKMAGTILPAIGK